jgi:hypothetical protein
MQAAAELEPAATHAAGALRQRIEDECLAGRLVFQCGLAQQIKAALESQEWRKKAVKIRRVQFGDDVPPMLSIALTPKGVKCVVQLLSEKTVPTKKRVVALAAMLRDGRAIFCPGLPRASSLDVADCTGAPSSMSTQAISLEALDQAAADAKPASAAQFLFAELFAGIGGFSTGLRAIGGHCVLMCEHDVLCQHTIRRNYSAETALRDDVTELHAADVPDHHILTGASTARV